jgi:hypothetical protein
MPSNRKKSALGPERAGLESEESCHVFILRFRLNVIILAVVPGVRYQCKTPDLASLCHDSLPYCRKSFQHFLMFIRKRNKNITICLNEDHDMSELSPAC